MYNNGYLASTGLSATGLAMNSLWIFLAGFAILAAGMAVARILPKAEA